MPFGFGVFIFLFLYIFKPFGLNEIPEELLMASLGFGIITIVISLANNFILPLILPLFFGDKSYTITHNLIISLFFIITIGIGNWLFYLHFLSKHNQPDGLIQFIFYTIGIGIFPMIIGTYIAEKRMFSRNIVTPEYDPNNVSELFFSSEINSDTLKTTSNNLVCIKSDGNYCEFYIQNSSTIKREVMRFTMKNVANIIENHPNIIRVHRSYFVNINKVINTSGTARNISLHIDNIDFIIPVSRVNEQNVTNAIGHLKK